MLDYAGFLKSARFWVHGVAVCVVCVLGLVGNVLTFAALGQNVGGGGGGGYVVSYCIYRSILGVGTRLSFISNIFLSLLILFLVSGGSRRRALLFCWRYCCCCCSASKRTDSSSPTVTSHHRPLSGAVSSGCGGGGDSNRNFNKLLRALAVADGMVLLLLIGERCGTLTNSKKKPLIL